MRTQPPAADTIRRVSLSVVLLAAAAAAVAAPATAPSTTVASVPPYQGKFEYHYGAYVLRVECHDDRHLAWTLPDGGGETVVVDRREISPGIYLTSWTEKDGEVVAQVADYRVGTLDSVLVKDGRRSVHHGTIRRLTP